MRTIDRVKKRFVEEGIESLERRPTTRKYEIKVDGDVEENLSIFAVTNLQGVMQNGRFDFSR